MDENNKRLRQLTRDLLLLDHLGQLRSATIELHAMYSRIAGIRDDTTDPVETKMTQLPTGVAIDPVSAARCTLDFLRTAKFMRGVFRAVRVARQRFPARPIEILYAGCGPFAPLAIPLMTQFAASEVRFTLLDIHQRSLDSARQLVEAFGFSAHVRNYVEADAATYLHPAESPPHIVIAETMQRALTKEPQVAVTLNLAPQLCAGGILIPEKISVDACLFRPGTEFTPVPADSDDAPEAVCQRLRIPLGSLLDLDMASVRRLRSEGFPVVRIKLPTAVGPSLRMMLRTQVTVFESIVLDEYEAGITCPYVGRDLDRLEPGSEVEFHYGMGSVPGFRFKTK